MRKVSQKIAAIRSDQRGVSAIEFSLFAGLLIFGMLNTADTSIYLYKRMQVENATQMGAQEAWQTCDPNASPPELPATLNCPSLTSAVTGAVQSTSLGANVSLQAVAEGYYCVDGSNQLQWVSDASSRPADCSSAGMPSLKPGDYIKITTTFTYKPLFPGVTVAGLCPTPITKTAWMRLD